MCESCIFSIKMILLFLTFITKYGAYTVFFFRFSLSGTKMSTINWEVGHIFRSAKFTYGILKKLSKKVYKIN